MIAALSRRLFPVALVVSAALLIKGYRDVGDGFSAGALAGLAAVLQYLGDEPRAARRRVGARWVRPLAAAGLAVTLAVAQIPALVGVAPPVTHYPSPDAHVVSLGMLELHTSLAFDFGIALLVYAVTVGAFDRLFYFEEQL